MSALMEPSTTMKFLLPLVLTPVTVFTSAAALPTIERPGSRIMVSPRSATRSRTLATKSTGLGNLSPLQHTPVQALLTQLGLHTGLALTPGICDCERTPYATAAQQESKSSGSYAFHAGMRLQVPEHNLWV